MSARKLSTREVWLLAGLPLVLVAVAHQVVVAPRLKRAAELEQVVAEERRTAPAPALLGTENDRVERLETELAALKEDVAELERRLAEAASRSEGGEAAPAALTDAWCRHLEDHGLVIVEVRSAAVRGRSTRPGVRGVELHFDGTWKETQAALASSDELPEGWAPEAFRMEAADLGAQDRRWTLALALRGGGS